MSVRIALTIDDAPSVANESQIDPCRMDRMRASLEKLGIEHCVAFVIGGIAEGNEQILKRWLNSGYELGNHTFTHTRVSASTREEFLESVQRCDSLLQRLGAFDDNRIRWFRFPSLDRGATPKDREELTATVTSMNYAVAHASLQFFDHYYEEYIVRARQQRDTAREQFIRKRYTQVAREAIAYQTRRVKQRYAEPTTHVAFCHFGPASETTLISILSDLQSKGVEWCSLQEVLKHKLFTDFDKDYNRTGFIPDTIADHPSWQVLRRLARLHNRIGKRIGLPNGPRWPYLL